MIKKIKLKKEFLFLLIIFVSFIFIRSLHFKDFLNWSQDQAENGIAALKIYREKKPTLIGPQISATYQGRMIFQGPITYYLFLFFLILGNWDPVIASYFFTLFAGLLIFILFYSVKKIANDKTAWILTIIYSFLPYYINYTRFLWNSTLQLSFSILLLLSLSCYKKNPNPKRLLFVAFFLGLLLQFHYQFIIVILFSFIYLIFKKTSLKNFLTFFIGIALGFSPIILFELRNNFYNLKTIILFLQNWQKVDKPGGLTTPHYYLTLSFLFLFIVLYLLKNKIKKINYLKIFLFGLTLFFYGLSKNLPKPVQSYWAPANGWKYEQQEKAYQIINSQKIKTDFNVADLSYYNTKAAVIKYFLIKDNYQINYEDYYNNHYLYVISKNNDYEKTLSYEVAFFKPRKLLNRWHLGNHFYLYLFERQK